MVFYEKNDPNSPSILSPAPDNASIFNFDEHNDEVGDDTNENNDDQSTPTNITRPMPKWYTSTICDAKLDGVLDPSTYEINS